MPKLAQNPCFSRAPPPCRARNSSTWVKQITRLRKAHQCCIFHGCHRSFLPSTFLKYWNNQKNQTLHDWSSNHISKKHMFFSLSIKYLPKKKQNNRRTASSKLLRPLLLMGLRMIQRRNAAIRVVPQGLSQCPVTCRGFTRGILAEKHNTLMIMITNHE